MKLLLSGGYVLTDTGVCPLDLMISEGKVFLSHSSDRPDISDFQIIDIKNRYVFPGFTDVHVHLREPGFSYKETIRTGSLAAAAGGFTSVIAMPNVDPPPDSADRLDSILEIAGRDGAAEVYQYGAITVGRRGERVAPLEEMNRAAAFSDDGSGVQNDDVMREAMIRAASLGKIIAAHCEDTSLLHGGCIHDGNFARERGLLGICSESEWRQVERDLRLAAETGCDYHVCHVSTRESVELIRKAKAAGVKATAETAPHYLLLDDSMMEDDGRFKMNPPLRSAEDRIALIDGLRDGTIDMIATDHAPHSADEKSRGLRSSLMGVVGLECAFPVLYTGLVMTGEITLERLVEAMAAAPARRFGIGEGVIRDGGSADLAVFDLDDEYTIDPARFMSKGRSTPFEGMKVHGRCDITIKKGNVIWRGNSTEK